MMAENLERGNKHDLPQAKSGSSCNDGYRVQLDHSSCILDELGEYGSNAMLMPQEQCVFSPSLPFTSNASFTRNQTDFGDLISEIWPPADVPSSLPDNCLTSTVCSTYDTRDYDPNDESGLGLASVTSHDDCRANEYASNYWNPLHASNPLMPLDSDPVALAMSHADVRTESHSATILHKRKRPVASSTNKDDSQDLIGRKYALNLCIKLLPDPPLSTVEKMAKGFGFHFDFVLDLCVQQREKRQFTSFHLDNNVDADDFISIFAEPADFSLPGSEDPVSTKEIDEPTLATGLNKKLRPNTELSQAADQNSESKRYRCPKCGIGISRNADLQRHFKNHGPPKFHCQYLGCDKNFKRKDKLNDHLRRVHGDITFKADIVQSREEDPDNDPDPGSSHGGGFWQAKKASHGVQTGARSTSSRRPAGDSSAGGDMGDSADFPEIFCPLFQEMPANVFMRTFADARIIRKLGQGGFGHVYELSITTKTDGNHEAFACKMIRLPDRGAENVIRRARNEIGILQALDHPNIISFTGAIISATEIMINTRPVADFNLKEFLNRQSSPFSSVAKHQLWDAVRGLASAVAYLHDRGRGEGFHGDIKPENILVIQDTEVKSWVRLLLADFGSARLSTTNSQIDHSNQAVTLKYCAPEWFTNNNEKGPPSDIWSFGCILTQIFTLLQDKTMADFEAFRARNTESKKDWTYHESLPVVNDWLRFLSQSWSEPDQPAKWWDHMSLISDMLSELPEERPSATNIVTRLEIYNKKIAQKTDQARNAIISSIKQPQKILQHIPINTYHTAETVFDCPDSKDLGPRPDECTSVYHTSGSYGVVQPTLIQYSVDGVQNISRRNHLLNGTVCSDTPRTHKSTQDMENGINCFSKCNSRTANVEQAPSYDQIIASSFHAESSISPKFYEIIQIFKDKVSHSQLGYPQPRQPYFKLKVVPNNRQRGRSAQKEYDYRQSIVNKSSSSSQGSEQKLYRRRRGRCGPFTSEKRIPVRNVCWNCQIEHKYWRFGALCDRCEDSFASQSKTTLSHRGSLTDYSRLLLPDLIYSRLGESAIAELLRTNVVGFTSNKIRVEMSSGPGYPKILLMATEFVPSNREFLSLSYVAHVATADYPRFLPSYAPPLGVYGTGKIDLKKLCLSHINSIIEQGHSPTECELGDTSRISWKVFDAVNRYRKLRSRTGGNADLLRTACMLHAIHHFMSRMIIFTRTSANEAVQSLRAPAMLPHTSEPILTSKLLNLQIKRAMYPLLVEMTRDLLDGLDQLFLRRATHSSWAEALCINLILCNCIEAVQIAADSLPVSAFSKDPTVSRHSFKLLRLLEDGPFRQLTRLFHLKYKTTRSNSSMRGMGFNPIQNGLLVDVNSGITQAMVDLVQEIRQIMNDYRELIEQKAENMTFKDEPKLLAHHMEFRKRNSGRLASKFLKSFL